MRRKLLAAVAVLLVALGGSVTRIVDGATQGHPAARRAAYAVENEATRILRRGFAATGRCGIERWDEKTLSIVDPASASTLAAVRQPTTIPKLRALRIPGGQAPDGFRVSATAEVQQWRLAGAWLVAYKLELDSDVHLELESAIDGSTMIAEIPDPGCVSNPTARALVAAVRQRFAAEVGPAQSNYTTTRVQVTLAGPGFFDFVHGQRGVAPNGIEVHPVLSFHRWVAVRPSP